MRKFQLETATPAFFDEVIPLFVLHYQQVAHYQDIKLAPDYERFLAIQKAGVLRVYTAREETGELIGYAFFLVSPSLHYCGSLQALQDILFIHPERRGFGKEFIAWCDEQLKAEGVQVVYHHVKAKPELDFSALLERMGYTLVDKIYGKRLDKEGQ